MLTNHLGKSTKQFLSLLLSLALVITLILPSHSANAAATPNLNLTAKTILTGDTFTLHIDHKPVTAKVTWNSSDKRIATVDKNGKVKGIGKGNATISCSIRTSKDKFDLKCEVAVKQGATEVLIKNKIDFILLGDRYDLNRTLTPADSNDVIKWSSSNPSVISPDKVGSFEAKKTGTAVITATTMSGVSDSVTIYVVKEKTRTITNKDIVDKQIVLADVSIGNLTIDNNVGDVPIILKNVTVGGTLTMESGAAYTVTTKECNINKVQAVQTSNIKSLSLGDSNISTGVNPSLVAGAGSIIISIDSQCNISVKQSEGATIQSFSVTTNSDGQLQIALEGFKGDLVIDSQSQSNITIAATACEMTSATVKNATEGQSIKLMDTLAGTDRESAIQQVNVTANAVLTVDVKAKEVKVSREVSNADVVIRQPVTKLINEGDNTSLIIDSMVSEVTVAGSDTSIEVRTGAQVTNVTSISDNTTVNAAEGSTIQTIAAYGDHSHIEGGGEVREAVVTGNDSEINTEGTSVRVALGTTNVIINGVVVKEEDKVAIATPTPTLTPTVTGRVTPSPTPRPTTAPTPSPTPIPTLTPTPTPVTDNPPVIVIPPYTPTVTPTPSIVPDPVEQKLLQYGTILRSIITAAKADDADGLHQAVTTMFEKRLAETDGTAEEWANYEAPVDADGVPLIDKTYFLELVSGKLQPGTELNENHEPYDSALYLYDQMSDTLVTWQDMDDAMHLLKDLVWESNLWFKENYDASAGIIDSLIVAIDQNDEAALYNALIEMYNYMNTKFGEDPGIDLLLHSPEDAAVYARIYRKYMLSPDSESDFKWYYNLYYGGAEEVYSRTLADDENRALWSASWWLSTDPNAQANLEQEKTDYAYWKEVMDNITIFYYEETATPEQQLTALRTLFDILGADEAFVTNHLDGIQAPENLVLKPEHLQDYQTAMTQWIERWDEDPVTGIRYRSIINSYNWFVSLGLLPEYRDVESGCEELVRSIIWIECMYKANAFMEALVAGDATVMYSALTEIKDYLINVRQDGSQVTQPELADTYLGLFQDKLADDTEEIIDVYYSLYNEGSTNQYNLNLDNRINDLMNYISYNIDWVNENIR
jgi:uncharacterized protein YjdB